MFRRMAKGRPKTYVDSVLLLMFLLVSTVLVSSGCSGVVTANSATQGQLTALTITVGSLPSASSQSMYSATLSATGGTPPYSWAVGSGSLPVGLNLSSSGQITGTPTVLGTASFTVTVGDSSSPSRTNSKTLGITVTSAANALSVTPASLSFGNVNIGSLATQMLVVNNSGNSSVTISGVTVTGAGVSATGMTGNTILAPSQSTTLNVSFAPTSPGDVTGSVAITSSATNSVTTIAVTGMGLASATVLTVTPGSLNFGNQAVNVTSGADSVSVSNSGSTSITINSVQTSAPFAVSGFSGATTLSSGQTLTLNVTFTPGSATAFNGTLTISSTVPPNTVSLSGTGVVQVGPDLSAPLCGLSNDSTNHIPNAAAWKSFTPPAVGGTYVDSVYGCTVKRLTDGNAAGVAQHHYYATTEPMSAGDTKVLIFDENGGWHLIDLNGNTVVPSGNMPSSNDGLFMWDRTDDNVFWGVSGNALKKCTVSGATVSCVTNHTFTEYAGYLVNFMDETDMTVNGWLPMVGQNVQGGVIDVFLWNPSTSTKSPVYTTTCTADVRTKNNGCLHKLVSTPNDGIIIQFASNGTAAEQGNRLWESPWVKPLLHVENLTDHLDSGKDLLGNEVAVLEDYADNPGPWISCINGWRPTVVTLPNVPTGCMFDAVTNFGWHASYRDWPVRGWTLYSAEASSAAENFNNSGAYADPSSGNWTVYSNELVLVRIDAHNDASKIYRLGLTHSREHQGFWAEPRAALSFDGKYVIFDSNAAWGSTGCGSISNCTDVYLIQIH